MADVERMARCRCGQLTARCRGEPVRVSVCHCLDCQRRVGGPFAAQARFPADRVEIRGTSREWEKVGESGRRAWFRWCAACGGDVCYRNEGIDEVAILLGCFAPGALPTPTVTVFDVRRQPWISIDGPGIHHEV